MYVGNLKSLFSHCFLPGTDIEQLHIALTGYRRDMGWDAAYQRCAERMENDQFVLAASVVGQQRLTIHLQPPSETCSISLMMTNCRHFTTGHRFNCTTPSLLMKTYATTAVMLIS